MCVCLFAYFISLLSSFLILSYILIYFLTHLLPYLSIYFFQNVSEMTNFVSGGA